MRFREIGYFILRLVVAGVLFGLPSKNAHSTELSVDIPSSSHPREQERNVSEKCVIKDSIRNFTGPGGTSVRFFQTGPENDGSCAGASKHFIEVNHAVVFESKVGTGEFLRAYFKGGQESIFLVKHADDAACDMTNIISVQNHGAFLVEKIGNCSKFDRLEWDGGRLKIHFPSFHYPWIGKTRKPPYFYRGGGKMPAETWIYAEQALRRVK